MKLTPDDFWPYMLGVAGIVVGGLGMMYPSDFEVGRAIVILSSAGMAALIFNQIWPAPLEALALRAAPMLRRFRSDPFIPLSQAARELYEANRDDWLGAAARQDAGYGPNPLQWCAYHITIRHLEIYGCRPPSTVVERIPPDLFDRLYLDDDVTTFSDGAGTEYSGLVVKRDDFQRQMTSLIER